MSTPNITRAAAPEQATTPPLSPLDSLSGWLERDMKAVNDTIMRHMQSPVALIPQLAGYLIASGGKRIRPLLTLASTQIYNGDMQRAHNLAAAVEFIHTATLLHDDVVDESAERRGQAAANLVFGNQASVLVGDFLFSRAFQLMTADGSLEVLRILSDASAVIAEGEVMQLATTGNLDTTMDQYIQVITSKTAALFAAACEVGPVIADPGDAAAAQAMRDYGMNLGIAFQIADDALDYSADQAKLGKSVGDDFREGKMTAPTLLALANSTQDERDFWGRTLAEKRQTPDDLNRAQEILKRHDAVSRSLALAHEYGDRALGALSTIPEGRIQKALAALVDFSIHRHH